MGSAPAASRLLVELPCPVRWQGFKDESFGGRSRDRIKPGAPVGSQCILRKVTLFGGCGDPLQKRILTHAPLAFFSPAGRNFRQRSPATTRKEARNRVNVGSVTIAEDLYQRISEGVLDYNNSVFL